MSVPACADEENFECTLVLFGAQSGCGLGDIIGSKFVRAASWSWSSDEPFVLEPGRWQNWHPLEIFLTSSKGKNWTTPVLLIIFGVMEPANSSLSSWPTDQGCDSIP
jgi:hypothetical protein